MIRAALLLATLWLASATCPDNCVCYDDDDLYYECDGITVRATLYSSYSVDCEGGNLTCSSLPRLQFNRGIIPSFNVLSCHIPEGLGCALEAVGARGASTVYLKDVKDALEPGSFRGVEGVSTLLMFEAGAETSVPVSILSQLPSLQHFRLCEASLSLTTGMFALSPNLTYLELSRDKIKELPPRGFQGLSKLKNLSIWKNQIKVLGDEAFVGLDSLEVLVLNNNPLEYISPAALRHTPRLNTLIAERVALRELTGRELQGVSEVTISNDVELKLGPEAFSNTHIKHLFLARCQIKYLPPKVFADSPLVNISLAYNDLSALPAEVFANQTALQRLDLSSNKIKQLPSELFAALKALTDLKLDGNLIEAFNDQQFAGLASLVTLSATNNRLALISATAFQGARSLLHLSLANNQLSFTDNGYQLQSYTNVVMHSPLHPLRSIEHLDLSGNRIEDIFSDWTSAMTRLRTLNLAKNRIGDLYGPHLYFVSSNVTVDLRENNITAIYLYDSFSDVTSESVTALMLDGNPFNCSCQIYNLMRQLRGEIFIAPLKLEPGNARCETPRNLRDTLLRDVPLSELTCQSTCDDRCRCDVVPYHHTLRVDCTDSDVTIPDPTQYGANYTVTLKLQKLNGDLSRHVDTLVLSHVGLTEIPAHLPNVRTLDLTHNRISYVPQSTWQRNVSLKLVGNPIRCDCWRQSEIVALINSGLVLDIDKVTCDDGALLLAVDVTRLCAHWSAAAAGGLIAVIGITFAILLYRYSLELKIILYSKGWCRFCLRETDLDRDKKYDAFLSFAHGDEELVAEKLLPMLEQDYKICVHYRDWVVGEMIPAQIARSVEDSRRTIIVLSKHFLASVWSRLEFRAAHVQALREKRARVIVVLLEDLTQEEDMDEELRAYLSTNTYIKWGDPWFQARIRYAMPRDYSHVIREENVTKIAIEKLAKQGLIIQLPNGLLTHNPEKF